MREYEVVRIREWGDGVFVRSFSGFVGFSFRLGLFGFDLRGRRRLGRGLIFFLFDFFWFGVKVRGSGFGCSWG